MMRYALLLVALVMSASGVAAAPATLSVATTDGPVTVERYAAPGTAPRPAVLILHGLGGTNPLPGYTRFADAVAAAGLDAWLFTYYTPADEAVMFPPGREAHMARYKARMPAWARKVDEIADFALTRPESSGGVGLLGLTNGGFLAVDTRIGAIAVFYGGVPGPLRDQIKRLPPLLALHGDADAVVPIAEGRALVDQARSLGGEAELAIYPGVGHGFDFDERYDKIEGVRARAIAFLARHLQAK